MPEGSEAPITQGITLKVNNNNVEVLAEILRPTIRCVPYYHYFSASDGDTISIKYFNDSSLGDLILGGTAGGLLSVKVYYLG